ncbi:hypothetical protein [Gracilinema caldarium]|uniref:hypothetical protein n=1 Tax=Gracilinema caldarium TaxID=215591 RepID=UPI0026F14476|nr:hypothetical protein [Gracilinema caldarium]
MKKIYVAMAAIAVALVALSFAGCASQPAAQDSKAQVPAKGPNYVVIDHKTMALGGSIPDWLEVYMNGGGLRDIEALPKYKDVFVFVGEDSGTNLNALRQWATGFSVAQDMARLVSTRVQARFAGAAAGSPDDEYGRYFENVVKTASDATYSGARKEADFWVLKRYFKDDGKTVDREVYDYYVLVTIDKETLKKQIENVLNGVKPDKPLTKEQQTAVDRVKQSFYEGF